MAVARRHSVTAAGRRARHHRGDVRGRMSRSPRPFSFARGRAARRQRIGNTVVEREAVRSYCAHGPERFSTAGGGCAPRPWPAPWKELDMSAVTGRRGSSVLGWLHRRDWLDRPGSPTLREARGRVAIAALLFAVAIGGMAPRTAGQPATAPTLSGPELLAALRAGGLILYF